MKWFWVYWVEWHILLHIQWLHLFTLMWLLEQFTCSSGHIIFLSDVCRCGASIKHCISCAALYQILPSFLGYWRTSGPLFFCWILSWNLSHHLSCPNKASGMWRERARMGQKKHANCSVLLDTWENVSLTLVSSFLPRVLRQHRGVGIIGVRAWDSRGDSRGTSSAKLFSLLEEKCSAQSLGELRIPEWGVENCGRGMGSSCTWGMGLHLSQAWLANQLLSPVWVLFKHSLFIHRSVH